MEVSPAEKWSAVQVGNSDRDLRQPVADPEKDVP